MTVKLALRGLRGESFADVARRTGSISGTAVSPSATDQQVLDAQGAAAAAFATDAEDAAITAQAAAATAPMVYTTTAAGLAAVSEGGTFWVAGATGLALYRDLSGVATLIDSLPLASTVLVSQAYGNITTQAIDTNLSGSAVPADIGQIFIGNTVASADAITIDSGANFPGGWATRRYLGTPASPTVVTSGTQLGYWDFRGYSGTQFWNTASIDAVVDSGIAFTDGELPPTKLRFATAKDDDGAKVGMELSPTGRLDIGHIVGEAAYSSSAFGDVKLWVNTVANDWVTAVAAQPATGAGYALRIHTKGETSSDYLLGGTSGAGSGTFKFSVRGNGDVYNGSTKILGARVAGDPGAATDAASTQALANWLRTVVVTHGLGGT